MLDGEMKPVFQIKENDCLSACIASILELNIKEVPIFVTKDPYDMNIRADKWLRDRGYYLFYSESQLKEFSITFLHNGANGHAVVSQNGKIVHDPEPFPFPLKYKYRDQLYILSKKEHKKLSKPQRINSQTMQEYIFNYIYDKIKIKTLHPNQLLDYYKVIGRI